MALDFEPSMPDLGSVRTFLRAWCDADVALDQLEASYVQAGRFGLVRVLYQGPGRRGEVLRLSARRVEAATGPHLEAAINARGAGSTALTGFSQAARYAPAMGLLFQVFPTDDRLLSLPVAVDGSAMTIVLEAALAHIAGGARLQTLETRVMR
jgi:hypothetical protein